MSFGNTKTPTKPTIKAKYEVSQINGKLALSKEQEEKFRKLFPKTMNEKMMELFGISFSTLQRFKRQLGLEKDMKVIRKKLAKKIKDICEKNGYYDSLRGKPVSEACKQASREKRMQGFHPMKALKENNHRRYTRICRQRSERRKEQIRKERKFREYGITRIKLHLPVFKYTRKQVCQRSNARRKGYIVGEKGEYSGERYTIYFDNNTFRSPIFEKSLSKGGFTVKPLEARKIRV